MKPTIDQSLLDQLPIGGPIFDFNFEKNWADNTAMFHLSFTMEDDTLECALVNKISIRYEPKLLN